MAQTHEHQKSYANITVKKLPQSEVEITGEITIEALGHMKEHALEHFTKGAELSGFRKGKAPKEMVAQKVGEMALLYEAAEMSLNEAYPQIVTEHKLDVIGQPDISITKIAPGNPLGFTIKVALMPTVELADYKDLAKKEMGSSVKTEETSEAEVEESLNRLRRNIAQAKSASVKAKESGEPETDVKKIDEKDLPPLTDEFVKQLGDFKTVADFKKYVKEGLDSEKRREARERKRIAIMDALVLKSTINVPAILIEGELAKMIANFKQDVEQAGMTFENYLKQISKTEEDIKKEWRPTAEKKAKFQLILNKIATTENITPEPDQVLKEIEHLLKYYKDADSTRARVYVETMLTNEKVFEYFESFSPDNKVKTEKPEATAKAGQSVDKE